jgi:hypothetical protein
MTQGIHFFHGQAYELIFFPQNGAIVDVKLDSTSLHSWVPKNATKL